MLIFYHSRTGLPAVFILLTALLLISPVRINAQTAPVGLQAFGEDVVGGADGGNDAGWLATTNTVYFFYYSYKNYDEDNSLFQFPNRKIRKISNKKEATGILVLLDDGTVHYLSAQVKQPGSVFEYVDKKDTVLGVIQKGGYSESWEQVVGDDIYALSSSALYVLRNGSNTPQLDTSGLNGAHIWQVSLDTAQNVYVATANGLFKQKPKDSTWIRVISLTQATNLYTVFIDRNNRILVGGNGGGLYLSTDNGTSWNTDTSGFGSNESFTMADDPFNNLYVTTSGHIYKSAGGTSSWQLSDSSILRISGASSGIQINAIVGDSNLIACTSIGRFVSTDQGQTWTLNNNGIRSESIYGIARTRSGKIILSNALGIYSNTPPDTTWTKVYPQNAYRGNLNLYHDKLGNIYTVDGSVDNNKYSASSVLVSTDGGDTWSPDTTGLDSLVGSLFYVDGTGTEHYCSTYYGSTYKSELWSKPHGGSWTIDTAGFPVLSYSYTSSMTSDDQAYLYVSGYFGGQKVMRRPLSGGTWVADTMGIPSSINYFTKMSGNRGLVVGTTGIALMCHSAPAGSWKNVSIPSQLAYPDINAICVDDSGIIFAAFYNFNGSLGVYFTRDSGATWIHAGLDGANVYSLVSFGDSTYALSYDQGAFYLGKNPIQTGVKQKPDSPNSFALFQNYPNPFNPTTAVGYQLPVNSFVTLKVYDILGREIKTLVNERQSAGTHSVSFNAGSMSSGIYFYRIQAGDFSATKKLVLLK
jgi:photosystem II stability/assembly factor-like uncharacterized protein